MKPLWLKDIKIWNSLPLVEKVEHLRKHYCTGPHGQSHDISCIMSETNKVLKDVIKHLATTQK